MFAIINKILDWFKSLFWKEGTRGGSISFEKLPNCDDINKFSLSFQNFSEMELTLVGLQYSGKSCDYRVIQ